VMRSFQPSHKPADPRSTTYPYHHNEGVDVNTTETVASSAGRPQRGVLASLSGLLTSKGSAVPSFTSVVVGIVCSLTGLFALGTATALAAAPEAPEAKPATNVGYTTATLNGVLNPKAAGEPGEYVFLFSATPNCTEGGASEVGVALGAKGEPVAPMNVAGLTPGTQYSFCLLERNGEGEALSVEPYPTFTTKPVAKPTVTIATPTAVTSTTASFSGTVNPNAPGGEPQDPAFNTAWHFECTPACPGLTGGEVAADDTSHEVTADATGLLPNTTYMVVLVASNAGGQEATSPRSFTAPAVKPTIEAEAAKSVTATSADLTALIDPNGAPTSYHVEYDTSFYREGEAPHGTPESGASTLTGRTPVPVSVPITGLKANVEYHWRLVATNAAGTETGPDHSFFYGTASGGLPDNRAYEMVTPPQKNGAAIDLAFHHHNPVQVSDDGSRVAAQSIQCFADAEACVAATSKSEGDPYDFARTSSGWSPHALAPPATLFESNAELGFNANEGTALFAVPNPSRGGDDLLAREQSGALADIGPVGSQAIIPERRGLASLLSENATADFSHTVYETNGPKWPSFDPTNEGSESLYEYEGVGSQGPRLVALAPGSSTELVSKCGSFLAAGGDGAEYGSLSEDGETVYFSASPCHAAENAGREVPVVELYVRYEHARSELISEHSTTECTTTECSTSPPSDAEFQGASSDGEHVFFASTQKLTDSASEDAAASAITSKCKTTGLGGCNLYESECPDRCRAPAERRLVDVSAGDTSGEGPRVQGGPVAISSDGSHVYFVAQGTLTSVPNSEGQHPVSGQPNLYVYERDASAPEGRLAFIATLSNTDVREWGDGLKEVNVTPDGSFLVFTSRRALTADDTRPGEGPAQVYRYEAQTGELVRISIGEQGFNDNGNDGVVGGVEENRDTGDANIVPADVSTGSVLAPRRPDPTMSDDGAYVFFESPVGLTPQALDDVPIAAKTNGGGQEYAQNVYEYHDGHVSLISDGRDGNAGGAELCPVQRFSATCLLGVDASGSNAFLATADPLVASDTDTQIDFYDARICEPEHGNPCIQAPPPALPPCLGEACHGTPAATPSLLTPGSVSFNGAGNAAPAAAPTKKVTKKTVKCKKGYVKNKKNKCVKSKKKAKKAKRASRDRRTN
jgi:hypothetical protein